MTGTGARADHGSGSIRRRAMPLSSEQIERYSRQIVLPEIGARGQERLLAATVALFGAGPLARLTAQYLAGAGIGGLALLALEGSSAAAARSLARDLVDLNPDVRVDVLDRVDAARSSPASAPFDDALEGHEVWVDAGAATLAFPHLAARATNLRRLLLAADVRGSQGWLASQRDGGAGCVVCAALHARPADAEVDLDVPTVGVVASLLACEVLGHFLGWGGGETRLRYDGATLSLRVEQTGEHHECVVCRERKRPRS